MLNTYSAGTCNRMLQTCMSTHIGNPRVEDFCRHISLRYPRGIHRSLLYTYSRYMRLDSHNYYRPHGTQHRNRTNTRGTSSQRISPRRLRSRYSCVAPNTDTDLSSNIASYTPRSKIRIRPNPQACRNLGFFCHRSLSTSLPDKEYSHDVHSLQLCTDKLRTDARLQQARTSVESLPKDTPSSIL